MFIDRNLNQAFAQLTAKQREVIELYADGLTVKEQAKKLGVTPSAIDQRLTSALRKLGISDRREINCDSPPFVHGVLTDGEASLVAGTMGACEIFEGENHASHTSPEMPAPLMAPASSPNAGEFKESRFVRGFLLGFTSGILLTSACYFSALWSVLHLVKSFV